MSQERNKSSLFRNLTVVVLTLNEEKSLPACLSSLPEYAQILVMDSGSKDKTNEIAERFHAKFIVHKFVNYAHQRNTAISYVKTPWILMLDADEILSLDLHKKLADVISQPSSLNAYRLERRLVFMNRKMRWGKTLDHPIRLLKKGSGKYKGAIHERFDVDKKNLGLIKGAHILHHSYNDLSDYFSRFNRYTTAIAQQHMSRQKKIGRLRLAVRFWFEFLNRYFLRLGFLDGYPGYVYALLSSFYAFTKYAKLDELYEKLNQDQNLEGCHE
jgi:glycosyltransferase involved in cell wall biosynthesis